MRASHTQSNLWEIGIATLDALKTERGVLASGRAEIYGCIFGRDSLITALILIDIYRKTGDDYFCAYARTILTQLATLQGREINIESGEEPGKCIHEFRPDRHEHLTRREAQGKPSDTAQGTSLESAHSTPQHERPWYLYPDGIMRNYDSVDATPLLLMAIHEYYAATGDEEFLSSMLPHVDRALEWLFVYGDSNRDGFIDYRLHPLRRFGGLATQSWMDSEESVFHEDGEAAPYAIAPVEIQGYTYAALRAWSAHFAIEDSPRAARLAEAADRLKRLFNEVFVQESAEGTTLAFALDGNGRPLTSARSSMGHCLFAAFAGGGIIDGILDERHVQPVATRLMQSDLFVPQAGIRTLSTRSRAYQANSYHNGSIWPHDTALIALGFERFGYLKEASRVRAALRASYEYFKTPLELFTFEKTYGEYRSPQGQGACRTQAWSAAALCSLSVDLGAVVSNAAPASR